MSELQEHQFCECDEYIREYRGPLSNEMRPYYLKSEADKVIADLKDKARHYPIMASIIEDAKRDLLRQAIELRHHKYKRCLAMARWCNECHTFNETNEKRTWLHKWHKCWLELAEKFKEAK